MREETRWFVAITASLAILLGWQMFFAPRPAEVTPQPGAEAQGTDAPAAAPAVPEVSATADRVPFPQEALAPAGDVVPEHVLRNAQVVITFRGAQVTRWELLGYRRSLTAAEGVDLCADVPPPCLAVGYADLAANPDEVTVIGAEPEAVLARWRVPGGALAAEIRLIQDGRLALRYFIEGAPRGTRFAPRATMGAVRDLNSTRGSFSGLIVRRRGETERIAWDKLRAGSVWEGTFSWVMWDAKYFARAALLTGSEVRLTVTGPAEERLTSATLAIAALPRVITGAEASFEFSVFGGAKDIDVLRRLGGDLDEAIDLGWTAFLARPLLTMLKLFHQWLGNYGWAIVLLTLLIKVALYPLTASSMRSMQKLAKLKPKIEELQKKFREDRARLNQEMMSLYQQEKVNPMGGCLPMILQIPIFFALYNVLLVSIELRHAPFFGWVTDLSAPDTLVTVHLLGHEIPIRVLVLIMGGTMWLQQKLSPSTMDPAQQKIFMIMPIVFTALFYSFPSGLVVYWLTNNIVSIVQQWWIMRPNTST